MRDIVSKPKVESDLGRHLTAPPLFNAHRHTCVYIHLHTRTLYECEWGTSETLSWGIGYKNLREKETRDAQQEHERWLLRNECKCGISDTNKVGVCSEAWWVTPGEFGDKNSPFRHDKQELCRRHPGEYSWVAIMHSDLEFSRGIRPWKSPGAAQERKPQQQRALPEG